MNKTYTHRSLIQKLGIKTDKQILVIDPIFTFTRYLNDNIKKSAIDDSPKTIYIYIHLFTRSQEDLKEQFPVLKKHLLKDGMLWISWPKGHCTTPTDLNEHIVRDIGHENGLVDTKIVSVNENWSALKFVYRFKDRN